MSIGDTEKEEAVDKEEQEEQERGRGGGEAKKIKENERKQKEMSEKKIINKTKTKKWSGGLKTKTRK